MADRDDAALKQFNSRSKQPKVLVPHGASTTPAPTQIFIQFDQGFGSVSDQIDDSRFRYMGSAAPLSQYSTMCSKRTRQGCMGEAFNWK